MFSVRVGGLICWKYSHASLQLKQGYRMGVSLATFYFWGLFWAKVNHQFQHIVYSNIYGHRCLLSNLVTGESQYHLCYQHILCDSLSQSFVIYNSHKSKWYTYFGFWTFIFFMAIWSKISLKCHEHMHYIWFNLQEITFPIFSLLFLFGGAAAPPAP